MMQWEPRNPEPPVTRTRVSDGEAILDERVQRKTLCTIFTQTLYESWFMGCLFEELKNVLNLRRVWRVLWVYIIEMRTAERDNPTPRHFLKHISLRCCVLKGLNKAEVFFQTLPGLHSLATSESDLASFFLIWNADV